MSDEERSDLKACAAVGVPLLFDYCTPFRTQVAVSLTVRIYLGTILGLYRVL